jgi:hypothetical protein
MPGISAVAETYQEVIFRAFLKIGGDVKAEVRSILPSNGGNHGSISVKLLAKVVWNQLIELGKKVFDPLWGSTAPTYKLAKNGVYKVLVQVRDGLVIPQSMDDQKFHKKAGDM